LLVEFLIIAVIEITVRKLTIVIHILTAKKGIIFSLIALIDIMVETF